MEGWMDGTLFGAVTKGEENASVDSQFRDEQDAASDANKPQIELPRTADEAAGPYATHGMAERPDNEVEEAEHIYLLMKEEYRISRNVRLAWFLGKLNQVIWPASERELLNSGNELDLLSVLPKRWQQDANAAQPAVLMPSTRATFLARRYRFIIELDLSPSTGIVDDSTGELIFDEVFHALSRCLGGLAQPFKVPGTEQLFTPKIFVTVLVYSSIFGLASHQVLVQGCQLERADLGQFLHHIYQQLKAMESNIADVLNQQRESSSSGECGALGNGADDQPPRRPSVSMVSADVGLVSMVRQGILALQLLPPNSSAGIIIITDGVMSVPDVVVCETLLNQLRSATIACSFVQVGGPYSYDCSFGYIPNVELMKFISVATFGSYLASCPEADPSDRDMNAYHQAFLTYSFLKTPEAVNSDILSVCQHKLFNEHLVSAGGNPALAMRRKKHTEKEVHAHLVSVVSVRLREGYTIREIGLTKGGSQLEVKLVLLWKHNMHIEYVASAGWPLDPAKRATRVEVTMEGSYDILHDISCTQRKPITSPYRTSVIRRFWNTLQSINQTDQMLVHLQSFNSVPENYTIPESTKNGVPLFYIPPGSTTPVLSLQHGASKESSQSQFASYWKPVLSMDANFWQRWLHMHRIAIILEHDMPVPKHLHTAGNNGRYSTIQCRISHSALTSLLRDWSSFVLVEGYSYVKLIYSSPEQPPSSFYLVRLISKTPCMVLRLGFPIGTPAHIRNKIVDELREQILKLRFPQRIQSKEATPKTKRKAAGAPGQPSPSKSPALSAPKQALLDRPCVVVLNKPLEKLLIRYEKLPGDFRTPFIFSSENASGGAAPVGVAANRAASSTLASLSRYFLHRRWVWAVQSGHGQAVATQAVGHVLSVLSEIRLLEGFHFAASGDGIVNMVVELPMKGASADSERESHSCIVQYVLFPPHATPTKDSFSTDDDNDTEVEAVDADVELNLVTECWVEPQSGTVAERSEQHRHLRGLRYQEVPQAIFPRDLACMSTMMTFEYLSQLCQNKDQVCAVPAGLQDGAEPSASEENIQMVPFQFDLIQLLPKCQQAELFFLTFSTDTEVEEHLRGGPCLPNELLLGLVHSSLEQELSDREIPVVGGDHAAFVRHVLGRERDGRRAPFPLLGIEELTRHPDRQEPTATFRLSGSSREMTEPTGTLQSLAHAEPACDESSPAGRSRSVPQWRCYAKHVSSQQILLTFLPATFADVLTLMTSGLEAEPSSHASTQEDDTLTQADSPSGSTGLASKATGSSGGGSPLVSPPPDDGPDGPPEAPAADGWESRMSEARPGTPGSDLGESRHLPEPHRSGGHGHGHGVGVLGRRLSQQSAGTQLKCPVYVYNCCLELLKEQLVHPAANRQPRDVFFRSLSQDRSGPSPWTDLLAQPHKHKELAHFCSLLQEHYQQSFAKGVYRSLQQSLSISSQDVLMAMDYCEESLQEIDITTFLQTLCGHIRVFRENGFRAPAWTRPPQAAGGSAAFVVVGEPEEDRADVRSAVASSSSFETEDAGEAESRGHASSPQPVQEASKKLSAFPLDLLQNPPACDLRPDVHAIIQEKFTAIVLQYFKPVPSSPHYFFYCPPSSKKEEDSEEGEMAARLSEEAVSEAEQATEDDLKCDGCITTESDNDLVVEYEEQPGGGGRSLSSGAEDRSDSNTVNQDQDSFSILDEGDSLLEVEGPQMDMPPLFLHITCSVNAKSCHGSTPIRALPTCLGEVVSCLEDAEALQSLDLNELSITLDIFVLTLPLEIEVMADFHHNRYASESSVSLTRSPGQPSSYRSDEELSAVLEGLKGADVDVVCGEPLSKLPLPHKLAIVATTDEIRWLLEDEMVSALRRSRSVGLATLLKVAQHVVRSVGRPHCRSEDVPLQFVFRPEQSLDKFKEEFRRMALPGYVLNSEQDSFYFASLSRLHPQRIHAAEKLSERVAANGAPPRQEDSENEAEDATDTGGEATVEFGEPEGLSKSDGGNSQSSVSLQLPSEPTSPPETLSGVGLAESVQSASHSFGKPRPSRVQSVVSSQGSLDSDMQGYDGGSSDSECESPTLDNQESQTPLMPDFWLIAKIHQDRVEVYSHSRCVTAKEEENSEEKQEPLEHFQLHQMLVSKIGELCRRVNQHMLLQDLHDTHMCNSMLVAESEEDIWKSESVYRQRRNTSDDYHAEESYQARDYLAATMHFIPGHFACDVVWSTVIHIHPRLKMGSNMGVSRAIQALRSVLHSFCVGNRKNMFVYQERTTKSVFYLRLYETSLAGKYSDVDGSLHASRSLGLARSQEPLFSEDNVGSRPVGLADKHILLLVHGVGNAGPEITDELVKVLRKRLDETTLDLITVMLVRNCKLTPADVEFIQPSGSSSGEVMMFGLPAFCRPWLSAVWHYLRQNLLIFLHVPKYTDSNTAHHFKHCFHSSADVADGDIYLYNKPGGQGTGGKGIACITLTLADAAGRPLQAPARDCGRPSDDCAGPLRPQHFDRLTAAPRAKADAVRADRGRGSEAAPLVRFDVWEQGNVSPAQLADKLQAALRHALCDALMELKVLPNPLCLPRASADGHARKDHHAKGSSAKEAKKAPRQRSGSRVFKGSPSPITLPHAGGTVTGSGTPESTTPTGKSTRRSFWDILSKPDSSEPPGPKTTDDIVPERGEEARPARRRHKTESVRQQWSQERLGELEQAHRRQACQLEEGDAGALHPVYQLTCQPWMAFMAQLGCPSVQRCSADAASRFLLPSLLAELVNLVGSLAADTGVKVFVQTRLSSVSDDDVTSPRSCPASGDIFAPSSAVPDLWRLPQTSRSFVVIGRNFQQWRCSGEQADDSSEEENAAPLSRFTPHKGLQRFEAYEQQQQQGGDCAGVSGQQQAGWASAPAPRQRFLLICILDKKVTLYSYNWSPDLGASLNRELQRLVRWQNARAHVLHCLLSQKMGLFHHHCFSDAPLHDDRSQRDPNPFLGPSAEPDTLLRSAVPPPASKEQGRLASSGRSLAPLHFPSELLPFDEALRDVCAVRALTDGDAVARHGGQLLDIKAAERRELEKQMKIENLFVTWQQRSAQSNMPIAMADLETLKQSSRLVHYCATPLLFDPVFRKQIQEEQATQPPTKKRHRSNDSTASGRDRSHSGDSGDALPVRLKEEHWVLDISGAFLQQYVQYLQSLGFILVQVRPQSPARSIARARAAMLSSMSSEGRMSFSYVKQKSEDSPKSAASATTAYHLQRALPGGIVLMELAFQGCYFCVKQYALECSRIPMGQSVNSQGGLLTKVRCKPFPDSAPGSDCSLSMLFTEECDKVRDLMHVHSFSYDFHLRVVHQYLVGCHMTLRQGYQLTDFLRDFITQHPDIPKFGRNHVVQGSFSMSTGMITAHQLYNYITDHASTYGMKPLRMSKATFAADAKKASPDLHEYALVALWNSSGSYKDLEGLHHHDDFDVSLVVCHNAAPFEEQSEGERHSLRLHFYVMMTSQRELFPRLTADMRRFKKLPQIHRELGGRAAPDRVETFTSPGAEQDLWEEPPGSGSASETRAPSDGNEFYPLVGGGGGGADSLGPLYPTPLFPLLNNEVAAARRQIRASVEAAMRHCRRDNLWRRLFHGEHLALDKLKLTKLSFSELEELLEAVQTRSVGDVDPQLDCFLNMSTAWYQSLIKVLLGRFPQSCRHFDDAGIQYLAVLNQKFTDCFVLVFLDSQAGKTSLKVVLREPLPPRPQDGSSLPPQLVSMYQHLESVINAACYNLWTGLL
ncbi:KICSTOR complex protein SZT2 isoform X2 [Syngnathoides biaculeatus]|uniref:KICSTOR complex protein SZT2 isoform X2 n=1 Tax=Syngnathoides biaculeatus TaxID=300417 RepID=UPI002ADDF2E1|nr:KICSTOR complex protein SZT2 isoform X2 [Syngnathoides biaculeatus]